MAKKVSYLNGPPWLKQPTMSILVSESVNPYVNIIRAKKGEM